MRTRSITYVQEMHCCGNPDDEATVTTRLEDSGAGEYLVLTAHEWAFSDAAEADQFAECMKRLLAEAAEAEAKQREGV